MNIICDVSGGLGKNILFTAVLSAIKKKYSKANIILLSSYPDVYIGNPNVNRVITHGAHLGIYKEFIMNDSDVKIFITDPYQTSDYITEKKHLIEIWCDLCGVKYNGELPELFISEPEKQYFAQFYVLDKPIFVIHPNGGAINQPLKYSWTRDIPQQSMIEIIEKFKHEYAIVHIKNEHQLQYPNTIGALDNFRSIAVLLMMSKKRLLIDSSVMHIAAALDLPSTVIWIGTSPKVFGYKMHTNIIANKPDLNYDLNHAYFQKYPLFEDISRVPYSNLNKILPTQLIIDTLRKK